MNWEVVLKFEDGYLRVLRPEDVHIDYISGLNDPEVNRFLDGVNRTMQTAQSVTEFVKQNQQAENSILFGIWVDESKSHCGTVRLHGIENYHQTAHIGICLFDKTIWGKKIGSKAIKAVTQWALDDLKLHWIEAGAYLENVASQKAFLAAGYEWIYDVQGKYILKGKPTIVKIYVARNCSENMTMKNYLIS